MTDCGKSPSNAKTVEFLPPLNVAYEIECADNNLTYTIGIKITGGQAPYIMDGNPIADGDTLTLTFNSGESYDLVFDDAGDCNEVPLTGTHDCGCIPPANPVILTTDLAYCAGTDLPLVEVQDDGTSTYNWYNSSGANAPSIATGTSFTPPAPGNYWIDATSPDNCISTKVMFTITEITPPAKLNYDNEVFCVGEVAPKTYFPQTPGNTLEWTGYEAGLGSSLTPIIPDIIGNYDYQIIEVSPENCKSIPEDLSLSVSDCECPELISLPDDVVACGGELLELMAQYTTDNLHKVEWINQFGTVGSDEPGYGLVINVDDCDPVDIVVTFNLYCDTDPDNPYISQDVHITAYPKPELTDFDVDLTNNGCRIQVDLNDCPYFDVDIDGDGIGDGDGAFVDYAPGEDDFVNVQVFAPIVADAGLDCSVGVLEFFDCDVVTDCPAITDSSPFTELCSGETANLFIEVDNDTNLEKVEWKIQGETTIIGTGLTFDASETIIGCDPLTVTYVATLFCNDNGTIQQSGQKNITVNYYPDFDPDLVSTNYDCENKPTISTLCSYYQIAELNVPDPSIGSNSAILANHL